MSVLWTAAGQAVVPGNRWDLLDAAGPPATLPRVSLVVPYYDAWPSLSRLLAGVARQTYPRELLEVVVADDGSPRAPAVTSVAGIPVTVVRQADRGFRAAAARNLGAAAATGEVLCFLDQDVVPEPAYVERATRLARVLPDALVVGRRRHADRTGPLPEPEWLAEAYRRTGNLLRPEDAGFRYVISAVMTCSQALFQELGGFDESFTEYGGEDWEFAYRAYNAGAVLAHEPGAVAWHDGPDWAERGTAEVRAREKAAEQRKLAALIPHPVMRTEPGGEIVDLVVLADDPALVLTGGLDAAVYRTPPPERVGAAARWVARVHDARGAGLLERAWDTAGENVFTMGGEPVLTVTSTRALRRAARWRAAFPGVDLVETLFGRQVREVA